MELADLGHRDDIAEVEREAAATEHGAGETLRRIWRRRHVACASPSHSSPSRVISRSEFELPLVGDAKPEGPSRARCQATHLTSVRTRPSAVANVKPSTTI